MSLIETHYDDYLIYHFKENERETFRQKVAPILEPFARQYAAHIWIRSEHPYEKPTGIIVASFRHISSPLDLLVNLRFKSPDKPANGLFLYRRFTSLLKDRDASHKYGPQVLESWINLCTSTDIYPGIEQYNADAVSTDGQDTSKTISRDAFVLRGEYAPHLAEFISKILYAADKVVRGVEEKAKILSEEKITS